VRGKKEKNRVYTRQARGWSHRSFWTSFKFFGRYGYIYLSISYLSLSFCIQWRKSIADRNLGQHNFSSNSAKRAYSVSTIYCRSTDRGNRST